MRKIIAIIAFSLISQILIYSQNQSQQRDRDFSGDLSTKSPRQILDMLSRGFDASNKLNFISTGDFAKNWVKLQDVNSLMTLIHSTQRCKCVVKVWSSYLPTYDYSTVGGQAMNMIDSYKNNVPYFPGLWNCAKNDSLRVVEIERWWKLLMKKK